MSGADRLLARLCGELLATQTAGSFWRGRLSSSALATAVGSLALVRLDPARHGDAAASGFRWLRDHANADGGWGDTPDSPSNLSTTLLAHAALAADGNPLPAAARWIETRLGAARPEDLAAAVLRAYGDDRTFSVPILTFCALAGVLGPEPQAWRHVPPLPFELAAVPRRFYAALRLPVVSYALPALIAIGLIRHRRTDDGSKIARAVRERVTGRVLGQLEHMQPAGGGFLEAAPLTGFVALGLAGAGLTDHPVARRAAEFLRRTQREDGSWPIDTDLALWVTTGAANALAAAAGSAWPAEGRAALRRRLLDAQFTSAHPFTGAAPGGWGWTDLSGAVPDADDTAGALRALHALGPVDDAARAAAARGVAWLIDLQNRDGGIPTFCRGWGRLPFDRSCPDLTAHALRAWHVWRGELPPDLRARTDRAVRRAWDFLARSQNSDGSWTPLWFGNQQAAGMENRTYGTAAVARALAGAAGPPALAANAWSWLAANRNPDGGWGAGPGTPSTVEETALAVGALAASPHRDAVARGLEWLRAAWSQSTQPAPSPIGLYFARLWYAETLYPLIFTVDALVPAAQGRGDI